jgi:hypothetical protein
MYNNNPVGHKLESEQEIIEHLNTYVGELKYSVIDDEYGRCVLEASLTKRNENPDFSEFDYSIWSDRIIGGCLRYNDSAEGLAYYMINSQARVHWTINA